MTERKIVENVWAFMHKASSHYASFMEQQFCQEMHSNCLELGMQSPIEDMFWIASGVLCAGQFVEVNPGPEHDALGELIIGRGVCIKPQAKIGNYRVDFLLSQIGLGPDDIYTPVVVELDGHEFHDKDKNQRSYEKARDRFLVKNGLRVLHFTGSDVVKDPFKVAHEALSMIGVMIGSSPEYNAADPLDMGV